MYLIQRVAEAEPVVVAVPPTQRHNLVARVGGSRGITLVTIPLDDCWARDIAPIFSVHSGNRTITAVDFRFNSWGGKFEPYDSDADFGLVLSQKMGFERAAVQLVMEGGSFTTDGHGTAIIVEPTILNDNRNPGKVKGDVETVLNQHLGINTVIWIPFGLLGDTDTDGHVDNVAVFCAEGRVMVQVAPSSGHCDAERLTANLQILSRARDSSGRQLEIVEIPWLPVSQIDVSRPCSYVNVYPTNTAVLVPTVGNNSDELALEVISQAFCGKSTVAIPSNALSYAGGGPHCMTMQIPSYTEKSAQKGDLQ